MFRALAAATVITAVSGSALAAGPAPPSAAPAPVVASPPAAAPQGVIVVAGSDDAGGAARSLAFDVYRDAKLRPGIDDATARVLAGDPPGDEAPKKVKELAELRGSIASILKGREAPGVQPSIPPGSAAERRLLASLGTECAARLVVLVTIDGGRPLARVLRTSAAEFERVELGAAIESPETGPKVVKWPGATILLEGLIAPAAATTSSAPPPPPLKPAPLAAKPPTDAPPEKPFYKSAWFWGPVAGVAAVGITVFALSKATGDSGTVHLGGHVAP